MRKHCIILIDTSWSMKKYIPKIIDGLNNFIFKLSQEQQDAYLSIAWFNDTTQYIFTSIPVMFARLVTKDDFNIFGSTCLYDALAYVIEEWGPRSLDEGFEQTILFVLSDGDDNASKKYKKDTVNSICYKLESSEKWKIIHCNTEISNLKLDIRNNIIYNPDNISELLSTLSL